jgi:acid stress-induced BolA-like protein IbaG/YrbA
MAIRILSEPPPEPEETAVRLREAVEAALPGASVQVVAASPGHFEVEVVSASFAGQPRVRQQQAVYAAIAPLMAGDQAPVHAIDRMVTRTP